MSKKFHSIDRNQPEIVASLRKFGASVLLISELKNCADIVVGYQGRNYILEIKDPEQPPSKRKLTGGEEMFHLHWMGNVNTIHTFEEALAIITSVGI